MIAWFQFLSLDIGSVFRCIKKFFILTQVNKVFLGLLYLAATSLLLPPFPRSSSAWHFSQSALWVYFSFPTTNILRRNNTTTWRKSKQKNTHKYLASFKALKQSYISTCDSSIRKFGIFLKRGMHIYQTRFAFSVCKQWKLCRVEVMGKRVNLGDGEGLQILCIFHFSGEAKFLSKLKNILPQLM